jgi:hypothetical protein
MSDILDNDNYNNHNDNDTHRYNHTNNSNSSSNIDGYDFHAQQQQQQQQQSGQQQQQQQQQQQSGQQQQHDYAMKNLSSHKVSSSHAFDHELSRRKLTLLLYLIRSPIFDRYVIEGGREGRKEGGREGEMWLITCLK